MDTWRGDRAVTAESQGVPGTLPGPFSVFGIPPKSENFSEVAQNKTLEKKEVVGFFVWWGFFGGGL